MVLALTIAGFVLHRTLHYEAGTVAMFGAILLLLLSRIELHPILAEVEWPTIFFFIGLFILVGGIKQVGLLDRIAQAVGLADRRQCDLDRVVFSGLRASHPRWSTTSLPWRRLFR